jgi:hypothetical protein
MYRSPSRGQATIGYAIVIGIALIGTVTVVALGATALTDIQTSSGTGAAEQVMTQFDSRTSQVALGDSESQTVSVGEAEGSYDVDPDAGYVRVVHANFTGAEDFDGNKISDGPNDDDQVLYESTLGTVHYRRGDTTVAYQSGGVWKKTGDGQGTMVSPPEFHYRGSTLTFPVVRVNQNGGGVQGGSGSVDLRTTLSDESTDIYPTRADGYPSVDGDSDGFDDDGNGNPYGVDGDTDDDTDGDGGYYDNPASNGTVVVYIQSEYYQAWASYFEDRTDGAVDTTAESGGLVGTGFDIDGDGSDEQNVVAVELASTGFSGPFTMPGEGSSLNLQGIADHSMSDFDITLAPDDTDSANFNNLQWSMYVEDGSKQFEMNVRKDTGGNCDNQEFIATIFYSPAGTDDYHGWQKSGIEGECADTDGDGDDETRLTIDLVDDEDSDGQVSERVDSDEDDLEFTYQSLSQSDLTHFGLNSRSLQSSITFDEHQSDVSWESRSYSAGSTEYSDGIVNHYFSLLGPGFDLTVDDKNSNTVTESASSGRIEYEGGDQFITYMHISENDVRVRID